MGLRTQIALISLLFFANAVWADSYRFEVQKERPQGVCQRSGVNLEDSETLEPAIFEACVQAFSLGPEGKKAARSKSLQAMRAEVQLKKQGKRSTVTFHQLLDTAFAASYLQGKKFEGKINIAPTLKKPVEDVNQFFKNAFGGGSGSQKPQ